MASTPSRLDQSVELCMCHVTMPRANHASATQCRCSGGTAMRRILGKEPPVKYPHGLLGSLLERLTEKLLPRDIHVVENLAQLSNAVFE